MGQGRQRAKATTGTAQARYSQICNEIVREISEGRLPPGSWLPTHSQIQQRWNVSNSTSRRVLSALEQGGWALSQGTRGYIATAPGMSQGDAAGKIGTIPDQPPTAPQQPGAAPTPYALPRPAHTIPLGGSIPDQLAAVQIIAAGHEPAPADVAHALQLASPGQPVCVRRRLLTTPDGATTLELRVSFTPGIPTGSPLTQPAVIPGPWPEILASHTQQRPTTATSYITVRQPTGYEAPALQISPQDPVLVRASTFHTTTGTAVDHTVSIWPATTTIYAEHHPLT